MSSVLLQLMALGVENVLEFDFMDKPSAEQLTDAFAQLVMLGAVEKDNQTVNRMLNFMKCIKDIAL